MNIMSCTPCLQNRILLAACREFFIYTSFVFSGQITINSVNSDRPMTSGYSHEPANQNILNVIPESASYPSHPRYEHSYPHNGHSSRHAGYRPLNHEPVSWNTPEYVNVIFVICITLTFVLNLVRSTGPISGGFAPHANRTSHEISIKSFLAERHITGRDIVPSHPNDFPLECILYPHNGLDQLPFCIPPV